MRGVNLASLDLNLLVSLDALLQQRSVTRAAAQMGLSQPALSASLARLRRHFDDELLTRVGQRVPADPAGRAAQGARPDGPVRGRAGVHRPAGVRPGLVDPGVLLAGQRLRGRGPRRRGRRAARRGGAARRLRLVRQHPAGGRRPGRAGAAERRPALLPHGFVTDLSHRDLYRDEWVCVVAADNPVVGDGADGRGPGDPALGGHLPRPDRVDAGRPPDADARHRAARSRWSPRTS